VAGGIANANYELIRLKNVRDEEAVPRVTGLESYNSEVVHTAIGGFDVAAVGSLTRGGPRPGDKRKRETSAWQ